jgi:hypothetical protein
MTWQGMGLFFFNKHCEHRLESIGQFVHVNKAPKAEAGPLRSGVVTMLSNDCSTILLRASSTTTSTRKKTAAQCCLSPPLATLGYPQPGCHCTATHNKPAPAKPPKPSQTSTPHHTCPFLNALFQCHPPSPVQARAPKLWDPAVPAVLTRLDRRSTSPSSICCWSSNRFWLTAFWAGVKSSWAAASQARACTQDLTRARANPIHPSVYHEHPIRCQCDIGNAFHDIPGLLHQAVDQSGDVNRLIRNERWHLLPAPQQRIPMRDGPTQYSIRPVP